MDEEKTSPDGDARDVEVVWMVTVQNDQQGPVRQQHMGIPEIMLPQILDMVTGDPSLPVGCHIVARKFDR